MVSFLLHYLMNHLMFEALSLYQEYSQSWRLPNSTASLGQTGYPASMDTGSSAMVRVGGFLCTEYLTSPTCSTDPSFHASEFSTISSTSAPSWYNFTKGGSCGAEGCWPVFFFAFLALPWPLAMPFEIRARTLPNASP